MLSQAHQGYYYQDILSAYFIAKELASGHNNSAFFFDQKKTSKEIDDRFDDLTIVQDSDSIYFQVKYSNHENRHVFTKQDISSKSQYDLALHDLFNTWQALNKIDSQFRLCLAWDCPKQGDSLHDVLIELNGSNSILPNTTSYRVNIDRLWSKENGILKSWRSLRAASNNINREEFSQFLDALILELNCPKTSLLKDHSVGIDHLLYTTIQSIGIGEYPNDHLSVEDVMHRLCSITRRYRSTEQQTPVTSGDIAREAGIILSYGGIQQVFPVEYSQLVETPERMSAVLEALDEHRSIVITGEPGAGKSWFISNLEDHLENDFSIVKHYCYTALKDPLQKERITVNAMYGSLIEQILQTDQELGYHKVNRYASNLTELNLLLNNIKKKTLIIVDGIDHIWRVYQRNTGSLTENETAILQALSNLDLSNEFVRILVVSQPIEALSTLISFDVVELPQINEQFVQALMMKQAVPNKEDEHKALSYAILEKSQGNALYTKYLIDHAYKNASAADFVWLENLPEYSYNLEGYYTYLYHQIQDVAAVPYALCGAAFSLSCHDLKDITGQGDMVDVQMTKLKPILKYYASYGGYMIYHESFKRFVIERIRAQNGNVQRLVYYPIVNWLEQKDFFSEIKAFTHLLKLYYEVENFEAITKFITPDFVTKSLLNAHPLFVISENFDLLKKSLGRINSFEKSIVICELIKVVNEFSYQGDGYQDYLMALKALKGREVMHNVLWYEDKRVGHDIDICAILIQEAYDGQKTIPWSLIPGKKNIPKEELDFEVVKRLDLRQYDEIEHFLVQTSSDPELKDLFQIIVDELDEWSDHFGDEWITSVPSYQSYRESHRLQSRDFSTVVDDLIKSDSLDHFGQWRKQFLDIKYGAQKAIKDGCPELVEQAIENLQGINWFYNWLIYYIKISVLELGTPTNKEIEEAFSFLVRDLEPFRGSPRACDLYPQTSFLRKSFRRGLDLFKTPEGLEKGFWCLEKVVDLSTSMQRSYSGPLVSEAFLDLVQNYLPIDEVIKRFEEYYEPLGSRRMYYDMAPIAFKYAIALAKKGHHNQAGEKFKQGVQYITAYGHRKDRTLSNILYPAVPFQKHYGTLSPDWFYDLYYMAMTVITHTDGKSTHSYPIEWFEEFLKVYPNEALRFLITETLDSPFANYHQESQLHDLLEDQSNLLTPTQWFLLVRTLPIASSDKILNLALDKMGEIDRSIQDVYERWVRTLPELAGIERYAPRYDQATIDRYQSFFGDDVNFDVEVKETYEREDQYTDEDFPTSDLEEALAYIENDNYDSRQKEKIKTLFSRLKSTEEKRSLMRSLAGRRPINQEKDRWLSDLFEKGGDDWLYMNVCMSVYFADGWYETLNDLTFLQKAYEEYPEQARKLFVEILGIYISEESGVFSVSKNLIIALTTLDFPEKQVRNLLELTKEIIGCRLPNRPQSQVNEVVYNDLADFTRDELVVALLISRLKTLTTLKSQAVIYGITYAAAIHRDALLRPLTWAFRNKDFLLPIHRALLLQFLTLEFDVSELPDTLLAVLVANYPTGYFMEDRYVYALLDGKLRKEKAPQVIFYPSDPMDYDCLANYHFKYSPLNSYDVALDGVTNAFRYKRDQIDGDLLRRYSFRSDEVITSLVLNADIFYSLVNQRFYEQLWDIANAHPDRFFRGLDFLIPEIILNVASHGPRPKALPEVDSIDVGFKAMLIESPSPKQEWVILASIETYAKGKFLSKKEHFKTNKTIWCGDIKPDKNTYPYSKYHVISESYGRVNPLIKDQPIACLTLIDHLETITLLFPSPYVLNALSLSVEEPIHGGFFAVNEEGEKVVTFTSWKEKYLGSISDGTEYPCLKGCSVQIRRDYYDHLLELYENPMWMITEKERLPF